MAVLTLHHWGDWRAGCAELRRVARDRVVVLSWDPSLRRRHLARSRVLPGHRRRTSTSFPSLAEQAAALDARVEVVPVPWDCADGFFSAFWRRPEAYLDPAVRAGISTLAERDDAVLEPALARLRADLAERRLGAPPRRPARACDELDLGYRLLVGPYAEAP